MIFRLPSPSVPVQAMNSLPSCEARAGAATLVSPVGTTVDSQLFPSSADSAVTSRRLLSVQPIQSAPPRAISEGPPKLVLGSVITRVGGGMGDSPVGFWSPSASRGLNSPVQTQASGRVRPNPGKMRSDDPRFPRRSPDRG